MKKHSLFRLVVVLAAGLVVASLWAGPGVELSADMKSTDAAGKVTTGKIYIKPDKIRQEIVVDGDTTVVILRMDKKISWTLLPGNQYMEMALQFDPSRPGSDPSVQYTTKTIGTETVAGYVCTVTEYSYKDKKLGVTVQWMADKIGFPVKTVSKNASGKVMSTIEYSNIKPGNQPDSLFEIPKGYQKFGFSF
ncbi:MAG TPA: DUF4412 domain-containing protein [Spirochaetia bacterium]|nr:DUF4412 domain-containing protein [Spirochaetia bacterium]